MEKIDSILKQQLFDQLKACEKEECPSRRRRIKEHIHDQCCMIVSKRRKEYLDQFPDSKFDTKKVYINVKKEIFGKNVKLKFTNKEIADQIQRSCKKFTKRTGFSVPGISGMTEKEGREADKFIDMSEGVVRRCGTAIQEVASDVVNHPGIVKIIEKEKANKCQGRRVLKKVVGPLDFRKA